MEKHSYISKKLCTNINLENDMRYVFSFLQVINEKEFAVIDFIINKFHFTDFIVNTAANNPSISKDEVDQIISKVTECFKEYFTFDESNLRKAVYKLRNSLNENKSRQEVQYDEPGKIVNVSVLEENKFTLVFAFSKMEGINISPQKVLLITPGNFHEC